MSIDTPEKISEKAMEKIKDISRTTERMYVAIGAMECQKANMVAQSISMRSNIEKTSRDAMIEAGIPEDQVENYKVDIKTGKILKNKDIQK